MLRFETFHALTGILGALQRHPTLVATHLAVTTRTKVLVERPTHVLARAALELVDLLSRRAQLAKICRH